MGLMAGWELHRLARSEGRSAWEALHDPYLVFNLEVMRAHDEARKLKAGLLLQAAAAGDETGMRRALGMMHLLLMEE